MEEFLQFIEQLRLLTKDSQKGVQSADNKTPDGIIPASDGSSFKESIPPALTTNEQRRLKHIVQLIKQYTKSDKKEKEQEDTQQPTPALPSSKTPSISPILSVNEKMRFRNIAKIFADELKPHVEARTVKTPETQEKSKPLNVSLFSSPSKPKTKKSGGGILSGIMGMMGDAGGGLSSILEATGGIGGSAAIMSSAVPILAGFVGLAITILAGSFALKWVIKGLKYAKEVDWNAVIKMGKIAKTTLTTLGEMVANTIEFIRENAIDTIFSVIDNLIISFGKLATELQKFDKVSWDSLKKGGIVIGSFLATIAALGLGPMPGIVALGALVTLLAGLSIGAFAAAMILLSEGFNNLHTTIKLYEDVDFEKTSDNVYKGFKTLLMVAGMGLIAPIMLIGSAITAIAGWSMNKAAEGMVMFSNGIITLFDSLYKIKNKVNNHEIYNVSKALDDLGTNLMSFSGKSMISGLLSVFSSNGIDELVNFASKHAQLQAAADSIITIKNALAQWSNFDLTNINDNLETFTESATKLSNIRINTNISMEYGLLGPANSIALKGIYSILGGYKKDSGKGIVSLSKEILNENKRQNTILLDIKQAILSIPRNNKRTILGSTGVLTPPSRSSLFSDEQSITI